MKNYIRNISFISMLLIALPTYAALVTVQFSGTIDGHLSTFDPSVISVPTGTAFSGTFTFDTDSAAASSQVGGTWSVDSDYSFANYRFIGAPYAFDVVIGAQNYSIQQTTIGIYDTTPSAGGPDIFVASTVDNPLTKDNPGGIFFTFVIDNTSSYYNGTDLPNSVPTAGFYKGFTVGARNDSGAVIYAASGEIDNLTVSAVPIPLSLPLFISGLGLLLGLSKKRQFVI